MTNSNFNYSFDLPRRQLFSFPFGIITHILNHCVSPIIFQNLQQTCKFFFAKKKVIVVDVELYSNSNRFEYEYINKNHIKKCQKCRENFQYWLIADLQIHGSQLKNFTDSLKSIYRCNLKNVILRNQNLKYEEISFLLNGGEVERLILFAVNIRDDNGTPATMDVILAKCPNLFVLWYDNECETISSKTLINLNLIQFNNKFESFTFVIHSFQNGKIFPKLISIFLKKNVASNANAGIISKNAFSSKSEFDHFRSTIKNILGNHPCIPHIVDNP